MEALQIIELNSQQSITDAKTLLLEYGHYMFEELNIVDGKISFYEDLAHFPSLKYKKPFGNFFVIYFNEEPAACIGLRKFDNVACEMKRMFVRPAYRGKGIGQFMIDAIIEKAKEMDFKKILLDTNAEMFEAVTLYKKNGFTNTYAYCSNQNPNAIYFEFNLM